MARGWESKSVEAQQDEAASRIATEKPRLTREAADRVREREKFHLALRNVLQQLDRVQDGRHRGMLEAARSDLERKLNELGV
jgi:hypothetical protein